MSRFKFLFSFGLFSIMLTSCFAETVIDTHEKPLIRVFYKEKEASMKAYEQLKPFLEKYEKNYTVQYLLITDPANADLMASLNLPVEHFPLAVVIKGKTSAMIDGEQIIFAHFPDFMHHIGRHQGNWTLEHLKRVMHDSSLLLPENPVLKSNPGGKTKRAVKQ